MDAPFHHDLVYPATNRQTFTPLPSLSHPFQHPQQQDSHTLPPPQPQRAAPTYANDIFNNTSRPPQASYPSNTSITTNPYPLYESNASSRYYGPQPSYSNASAFSSTSHFSSQLPNTLSYSSNAAPLLTQRLPDLAPMPIGGSNQTIGSLMTQAPSQSLNSSISPFEEKPESPPTHVVGAQGRRGILPSAAGRPAAITSNGSPTTKQSMAPVKDADGKFPCPHCSKTYLHAKHLKRHLLRRMSKYIES